MRVSSESRAAPCEDLRIFVDEFFRRPGGGEVVVGHPMTDVRIIRAGASERDFSVCAAGYRLLVTLLPSFGKRVARDGRLSAALVFHPERRRPFERLRETFEKYLESGAILRASRRRSSGD